MQWRDFYEKKVGLIGASMENVGLLPHLFKAGAIVTIFDRSADQQNTVTEKFPEVTFLVGDQYLDQLSEFDYIFRSPGVPVAYIDEALKGKKHQPIRTSAMNLFFGLGYKKQIIGVTGTKGKGTTSTMLGSILSAANKKNIVAGNIGKVIWDVLDEIDNKTIIVMELSSFQLEDMTESPHIAVVLPITEDHLQPLSERSPNYHSSVEKYVEAKAAITKHQTAGDVVIYDYNDPSAKKVADYSPGKKVSYAVDGIARSSIDLCGDEHEFILKEGGYIDVGGGVIRGRNQIIDGLAASAAALELGISIEKIEKGLRDFQPLPHRQEIFFKINDITFVDDSYATTPDAAIGALGGFDEPVIWIGGGSSKGADFTELAKRFAWGTKKAAILIGQESERIKEAFLKDAYSKEIPIFTPENLRAAVSKAIELAVPGDVILLSPACASKDMFKDAADRGDQFKELVKEIATIHE